MRKRILSILLTVCMVLCLAPTSVFAEGETAEGSSAIRSGTDAIHGYNAESGYSYIYYGTHNNSPIKWRVLDTKTNTGASDALFLLTDECMGSLSNGYIQFNPADKADRYLWKGSNVQTWCTNFYNTVFTTAERALIPAVTQANSEYLHREAGSPSYSPAFKYQTGGLEAEYVFAPSIQEINNANYGFATGYSRIAGPFMTEELGSRYWIRSYFNNLPHYVGEYANMTGDQIATSAAVRPAMNLSTAGNSILFASAAVGSKSDGGLQPVSQNYTGNEWKLTLYDSTRNDFMVTTTEVSASTKGDTVEISYTDAKTGANEYISALIFDEVGNTIYYGRSNAPLAEKDGTAQLTIPAGFAEGTYTLKVYNEQYNGDRKTDLASGFTNVTLTVEKRVDEQFTLTPGGRYYFDLSAMDIPGTANSNLPDSTLHYVPFTYVGTVDAYKLTSETATTEEYAQENQYEHSLFIANYNVTQTVSWDDLNIAGLIFGKDYSAGGVDYTLRAPSEGSVAGSGTSMRCKPQSNEWDTILDKDDSYIKNWSNISSWGQDTDLTFDSFRTIRGEELERYWNASKQDVPLWTIGYRPVLELPTDLAADSLKVVEVRTGETKIPGETGNWINIIVKKGESFTAPAAEGLPRPNGVSADAPLWWTDGNGNYYKPGSTVPANVSMIYPLWSGFGLLLDRGDGAIEVTPDNYTDIFGDGSASFVLPRGESFSDLINNYRLNEAERQKIYLTGKYGENIFPNLKLKNAELTSVTLNKRYIEQQSPLFITPDGENTVGSLNGVRGRSLTLSILSGGTLALNSVSDFGVYAQNDVGVTVTDALSVGRIYMFSGSLTVTDDTQAVTLGETFDGFYPLDVRLFAGDSAQDAKEVTGWQLSPEMRELYRRFYAGETLTSEENNALISAVKGQWDVIRTQLSGKTYARFANAWNVTYQPGANGTGDAVTDMKFYNDILTLRGKLFTRTGYTQVGWATVDGGEKIYGLDAVYTQNEALTLYPVWNAHQYTITFDTAGGSSIANKTNVNWTDKVLEGVESPVRDTYEFIGWTYNGKPFTADATYADLAVDDSIRSITLTAKWRDIESPTGEISIGTNKWKTLLNNITFGLFFKDTQTVTITAADNSGEKVKVEYLLSGREMTILELADAIFTEYNGSFSINPDHKYIIYVSLVDTAGNGRYICSDGIVLDGTSPVITGLENGKTYCAAQTVTVDEQYVDTVTVNGTAVTLDENNRFVLAPAVGAQEIVVTDKAGNTAEMTVTVNDGHTYGEWASNGDGTHTRKCTVDGCNGSETKDCSGGKATCAEKAVCDTCGKAYGEIDANSHAALKHVEAKAATRDAEGNIEYWYCDGCGRYFGDAAATKEIKQADTVTAKLPNVPESPQTGDRSNFLLWIALLFIGGGVAISITAIGKKCSAK